MRELGWFARAYSRVATSALAEFISRHISWKLDPVLLRATRGRIATTLVFPTAVLETRGAASGKRRRNAIIYFHDSGRVVIAASNAGAARNPDWYHNLRAQPEVRFAAAPMIATVIVDDDECERLWLLADRFFPAFADYRSDAADLGRSIPLIALTPSGPSDATSPSTSDGCCIADVER